jgi:hypothetical protein
MRVDRKPSSLRIALLASHNVRLTKKDLEATPNDKDIRDFVVLDRLELICIQSVSSNNWAD